MSNNEFDKTNEIQLLTLAQPYPCSYLPDEKANSIFLGKGFVPSFKQYSELSRMGFRRSGDHYYRPNCPTCSECKSCRVLCNAINLNSKRFKRIISKAQDLQVTLEKPQFSSSHYNIYSKYINERHADGDMYPATIEQYKSFLLTQTEYSHLFTIRNDKGEIISSTAIDILDDGISAIYTYFDPDHSNLSPGTLAIIMLIKYALNLSLPYIYLGYWVKNSPKMAYKKSFQPLEVFNGEIWQSMTDQD